MAWNWRDKTTTCAGSVLFRGRMAPRQEEFAHLFSRGFTLAPTTPGPAARWSARVTHPRYGAADVVCLRECPRPPRHLIDFDPMLTRAERDRAYLGESTVSVVIEGERADVLRDRKTLLRFMRAVMGDDGVVCVDHTAQRFWPREALDDELAHDADLDIESLYNLHAVTSDEDDPDSHASNWLAGPETDPVVWLHSHGLAEIGLFDFDILNPSEDLLGRGRDAVRAIAFAILEKAVTKNTPRFALMNPGGDVRFVDVAEFARRGGHWNDLRHGAADDHSTDRAVLCDPAGSWWSRRFGRLAPSRLLSDPAPDEMTIPFSTAATNLMAERARGTYLQFRQLAGEFAEFDFPVIVKLGYLVDGGGPDDREHLWFTVNELADDRIDATLENEPFSVTRLKKGQRAWHDLSRMTDWAILSPLGAITPRHAVAARQIRGDRARFRQLLREARQVSEAG